MIFKINNFFLLIILILLQSCSGGSIGNFLESSFKNIEGPRIKEANNKKFEDNVIKNSSQNIKESKNIEGLIIEEDSKKTLINKKAIKSNSNPDKSENVEDTINGANNKKLKDQIFPKSEKKSKNIKKIVVKKDKSLKKSNYKPQSYKIIFILKDVDPKDPIEDLSTILRNSDVNFEIEKIERFFDSKNKSTIKN